MIEKAAEKGLIYIAIAFLMIGLSLVLFVGQRTSDEISPHDFSSKTVHYRFQINGANQSIFEA